VGRFCYVPTQVTKLHNLLTVRSPSDAQWPDFSFHFDSYKKPHYFISCGW